MSETIEKLTQVEMVGLLARQSTSVNKCLRIILQQERKIAELENKEQPNCVPILCPCGGRTSGCEYYNPLCHNGVIDINYDR